MILVTGGAGFIGSNYCINARNKYPDEELVICDVFGNDKKWRNIVNVDLQDIISPCDIESFISSNYKDISAVIHMGAISATTETNVELIINTNFKLSCLIWNLCSKYNIKLVYASSAATYGLGENGFEDTFHIDYLNKLKPINAYGWSKNLFDKWVYKNVKNKNHPKVWAGLKFFNVYGPNEMHKGSMMSLVPQAFNQVKSLSKVKLFKSNNAKFDDGMQHRDFVHVEDCIKVIDWIINHKEFGDILNVGTGVPRTFNDLAYAVFNTLGLNSNIEYIEMPELLSKQYQNYTKADISKLMKLGYSNRFLTLEEGVEDYITNYLEHIDE